MIDHAKHDPDAADRAYETYKAFTAAPTPTVEDLLREASIALIKAGRSAHAGVESDAGEDAALNALRSRIAEIREIGISACDVALGHIKVADATVTIGQARRALSKL